jgi:hypothetical protein
MRNSKGNLLQNEYKLQKVAFKEKPKNKAGHEEAKQQSLGERIGAETRDHGLGGDMRGVGHDASIGSENILVHGP